MNSVLIRSKTERDEQTQQPLYWSNKDGWVDKKSADKFRPFEKASLNLPVGGEWVRER